MSLPIIRFKQDIRIGSLSMPPQMCIKEIEITDRGMHLILAYDKMDMSWEWWFSWDVKTLPELYIQCYEANRVIIKQFVHDMVLPDWVSVAFGVLSVG